MPNLKLVLEYDGKPFSGWQIQPGQRSIQEELHKALQTVLRQDLPLPVASGRTDAGVSARAQVVSVKVDSISPDSLHKLVVGVSSILKNEVTVLSAEVVDDSFHPIRDAVRKQYSYRVWNHPSPPSLCYGSSMHVVAPLNIDAIRAQAELLLGEHDFSSFRAAGCGAKSPVRTLEAASIERNQNLVIFSFQGKGFLKQMVRSLVGTLLLYGKNPEYQPGISEILAAKDRTKAGPTAEPWGLTLDWVEYSE